MGNDKTNNKNFVSVDDQNVSDEYIDDKYIEQIYYKKEEIYAEALSLYENGTEESIRAALAKLEMISPFRDSESLIRLFKQSLQRECSYSNALTLMSSGNAERVRKAGNIFMSLGDYKDSAVKCLECNETVGFLEEQERRDLEETLAASIRDYSLRKTASIQAEDIEKGLAQQESDPANEPRSSRRLAHKCKKDKEKREKKERKEKHVGRHAAKEDRTGLSSGSLSGRKILRYSVITVLFLIAIGVAVLVSDLCGAGFGAVSTNEADQTDSEVMTLESFLNSNDQAKQQVEQSVEGTDVELMVSENTLYYNYDLSGSENITPENVKSEDVISSLKKALDESDENFVQLCRNLENDTGIAGISVQVTYSYNGSMIISRHYTSSGRN